jgi:hypothetical protein
MRLQIHAPLQIQQSLNCHRPKSDSDGQPAVGDYMPRGVKPAKDAEVLAATRPRRNHPARPDNWRVLIKQGSNYFKTDVITFFWK